MGDENNPRWTQDQDLTTHGPPIQLKVPIPLKFDCGTSFLSTSPNMSPGRRKLHIFQKQSKALYQGDRFIASRKHTDYSLCHYKTCQLPVSISMEGDSPLIYQPKRFALELGIRDAAFGKNANTGGNLLRYSDNPPPVPMDQLLPPTFEWDVLGDMFDATGVIDDFYLNLFDWSASNIVAVGIGSVVCLWNINSGKRFELLSLAPPTLVCSLAWIKTDAQPFLAVGTSEGITEVWDCQRSKRVRKMKGHAARVGSLSWNSYVITSGCKNGRMVHHDLRCKEHFISKINSHSSEICGLKWSLDGKYLASGGNDSILKVWSALPGANRSGPEPLYTFSDHKAAVKGLAWCPWSADILASGGGTEDSTIKIWNVKTGKLIEQKNTDSQVCSLVWSSYYQVLISGHAHPDNQLIVWKFPSLHSLRWESELFGHISRILSLGVSPDEMTVLSLSADETMRMWNHISEPPPKKNSTGERSAPRSLFDMNIR